VRNLKIGTKILAIILLVSLFSLFFISVVSYTEMLNLTRYSTDANTQLSLNSSDRSQDALKKQAEEYIVKIAREQAMKSDTVLLDVQRQVTAMGEYMTSLYRQRANFNGKKIPRVQDTEMDVPAAKYMLAPGVAHTAAIEQELALLSNAEYMLAPIYKNNRILDNIYLGTLSGISYRYSPYNTYNPDYDPRQRDWYKTAMTKPETPIWVDTYVDTYGTIVVTNAITFNGTGDKPQGVLATDITLDSMKEDVISMKIGQTGYAFMLDNLGNIIAHPKYSETFNTEPLKTATGDYLKALEEIMANPEGLTTAHLDGKLSYLAYSKLPTTQWSLVIVVEVEEIIQPALDTQKHIEEYTAEAQTYISSTLRSVLIRLVIVLAVSAMAILVFSYLVSRTITNPIKLLLKKVGQIGQGDLEVQIVYFNVAGQGRHNFSACCHLRHRFQNRANHFPTWLNCRNSGNGTSESHHPGTDNAISGNKGDVIRHTNAIAHRKKVQKDATAQTNSSRNCHVQPQEQRWRIAKLAFLLVDFRPLSKGPLLASSDFYLLNPGNQRVDKTRQLG